MRDSFGDYFCRLSCKGVGFDEWAVYIHVFHKRLICQGLVPRYYIRLKIEKVDFPALFQGSLIIKLDSNFSNV